MAKPGRSRVRAGRVARRRAGRRRRRDSRRRRTRRADACAAPCARRRRTSAPKKNGRLPQRKSSAIRVLPRARSWRPGTRVNDEPGAPTWPSITHAEDEHQHELDGGRDEEHAERRQRPEQHEPTIATGSVISISQRHGSMPGKTSAEHLVDDVGDRVRQVEEVADRPDRRLDERGAPADAASTNAARPPAETISSL